MKKKNKIAGIVLLSAVSGFLLSGCSQNAVDQQVQPGQSATKAVQQVQQVAKTGNISSSKGSQEKIASMPLSQYNQIKQTIDDQSKQINDLTDEVNYYRGYVKDFTASFNSDKMNQYINKEWTYHLGVNNVDFPQNGILQTSNKSFDLVLSEDRVKYSVLPDEMSKKGKIQEGLDSALTFEDSSMQHTDKPNLGDIHSTYTYSFSNLSSNTTIKIKIPDDLKNKLNLNTNELQIQVQ